MSFHVVSVLDIIRLSKMLISIGNSCCKFDSNDYCNSLQYGVTKKYNNRLHVMSYALDLSFPSLTNSRNYFGCAINYQIILKLVVIRYKVFGLTIPQRF